MQTLSNGDITVAAADNANNGTYAIAGSFFPADFKKSGRILLTKLSKNKPMSNPFDVLWAKSYVNPNDLGMNFNVNDVLYTSQGGYVIAGQAGTFESENDPNQGFLLRTDENGSPLSFKFYPEFYTLTSVQQHADGAGFVAVGETIDKSGGILSVSYDLLPICAAEVKGKLCKICLWSSNNDAFFIHFLTLQHDRLSNQGIQIILF